jgi:hypothetical protein
MLDDDHLHIDEQDQLTDVLSKALRSAKGGSLGIDFADEPAVKIIADSDRIAVDLLQPGIFAMSEDDTGLFDKLKTATEFARKLSDNGITLSFLRKGKEAIRLGKDASPTLSKLISRSDDVQLTSVKEFTKLKGDFKTDK